MEEIRTPGEKLRIEVKIKEGTRVPNSFKVLLYKNKKEDEASGIIKVRSLESVNPFYSIKRWDDHRFSPLIRFDL